MSQEQEGLNGGGVSMQQGAKPMTSEANGHEDMSNSLTRSNSTAALASDVTRASQADKEEDDLYPVTPSMLFEVAPAPATIQEVEAAFWFGCVGCADPSDSSRKFVARYHIPCLREDPTKHFKDPAKAVEIQELYEAGRVFREAGDDASWQKMQVGRRTCLLCFALFHGVADQLDIPRAWRPKYQQLLERTASCGRSKTGGMKRHFRAYHHPTKVFELFSQCGGAARRDWLERLERLARQGLVPSRAREMFEHADFRDLVDDADKGTTTSVGATAVTERTAQENQLVDEQVSARLLKKMEKRMKLSVAEATIDLHEKLVNISDRVAKVEMLLFRMRQTLAKSSSEDEVASVSRANEASSANAEKERKRKRVTVEVVHADDKERASVSSTAMKRLRTKDRDAGDEDRAMDRRTGAQERPQLRARLRSQVRRADSDSIDHPSHHAFQARVLAARQRENAPQSTDHGHSVQRYSLLQNFLLPP